MTLDDELFNDPVNDEDMLEGDDDDEEEDEDDMNLKDDAMEDIEEQGQGEDEDDVVEEEEDGEEGNDDDDDEQEDDDDADDDEGEDGDGDNPDESKYMDAKETPDPIDEDKENEKKRELRKNKEDILGMLRDDEREQSEKSNNDIQEDNKTDIKRDESEEDKSTKESKKSFKERIQHEAEVATKFDIVPTVAIPYSTQCHAIAFSEGPRSILTGGEDGFIRKYDFIASIEGKSPLTMAQKHNLVDTVTKAGVIVSYWENEQPQSRQEILNSNPKLKWGDFAAGTASYEPKISPVYSLDVNRNGYWCLSGLSSGGISLYSMRYNEGSIHHYFMHGSKNRQSSLQTGHKDTVSVIKLNTEQDKFLSGSWDKTIREWDLNTGKCINLFQGSSGQISNIQYRPMGLSDMSISLDEEGEQNGTATKSSSSTSNQNEDAQNSDMDSLFGDSDEEEDDQQTNKRKSTESQDTTIKPTFNNSKISNKVYGNENVFMSSSIDGTINIWDVRSSESRNSVLRLGVPDNTPPWCMSSTWSNCGEFIYAGRRNSTVEEFSIKMPHKRSRTGHNKDTMTPNVLKTLQFPKISGPISSISTMPNKDFLLCGSNDNIRLYNLSLYNGVENSNISTKSKPATPFMIIPGHHGGILSALWLDDTGRFMVSASGNRGWGHSNYTETILLYEIDFEN